MRITKKFGLGCSALLLTGAGVFAALNSDRLVSIVGRDAKIAAVDDLFSVNAGRDQRLFVLKNDVTSGRMSPNSLKLVDQPSCGSIKKTGGSFVYSGSVACSGNQTFSYCLEGNGSCDTARVTLHLVQVTEPIDSITNGPITDLSGQSAQIEINSAALEITNVRLGKTLPSETKHAQTPSSRLASAAMETTPEIRFAKPAPQSGSVSGIFSMSASDASNQFAKVTQNSLRTDTSPLFQRADLAIPSDPRLYMNFATSGHIQRLTRRMISTDTQFNTPSVMPGIDASPFGTPCTNSVSTSAATDGMVHVLLTAACLPNTRVEIHHSKMTFALKTGHSGTLDILVPALEENALFSFVLADGTVMRSAVHVPGIKNLDRVAVQWRDTFDVKLTTSAFGKGPAPDYASWQLSNRGQIPARAPSKGYSVHLGDSTIENPVQIIVYSYANTEKNRSGVIEIGLTVRASKKACGGSRVVHSYRSRRGRLVRASGLRFKLPDCGDATQSIVLKNAVRDLIIASN